MTNPLTPNYNPGVGRLVTDRFDFQTHITGTNFRHAASQIDLAPYVTIDGYTATTVQSAINILAQTVSPPIIAITTTTSKGIIQLSGDLAGTASAVRVTGLQGNPVSTLSPTTGNVLTWNGIVWAPSAATNAFTASGDLTGNNISQQVISLSGLANIVSVFCNNINFFSTLTPSLTQSPTSSGSGAVFNIKAQSTSNISGNGGNIIISGGNGGTSGVRGGVMLKIADTLNSSIPLQAIEVAPNRRVISLMHTNVLTSSDMPSGTGDMVMYVRDAMTTPASGVPTNGTIVYSSGGQLWVKQGDGNNFVVGSIPNPNIWGAAGQQVYSSKSFATTTSSSTAQVFNYAIPSGMAVKLETTVIGINTSTNDVSSFTYAMGYVSNGVSLTSIGSLVTIDSRGSTGASSWIAPTVTTSGNNVIVLTGAHAATTISWLGTTKLTIVA